jgi:hypothetical protein
MMFNEWRALHLLLYFCKIIQPKGRKRRGLLPANTSQEDCRGTKIPYQVSKLEEVATLCCMPRWPLFLLSPMTPLVAVKEGFNPALQPDSRENTEAQWLLTRWPHKRSKCMTSPDGNTLQVNRTPQL